MQSFIMRTTKTLDQTTRMLRLVSVFALAHMSKGTFSEVATQSLIVFLLEF